VKRRCRANDPKGRDRMRSIESRKAMLLVLFLAGFSLAQSLQGEGWNLRSLWHPGWSFTWFGAAGTAPIRQGISAEMRSVTRHLDEAFG
jgi:hypothetical protein